MQNKKIYCCDCKKELFIMLIKNENERSRKVAKEHGFKYSMFHQNFSKYTRDENEVWRLYEKFKFDKDVRFNFTIINK